MEQLNILFLGGAKRVSVANHLKNYGKDTGIKVNIFSYELDNMVPIASVGEVVIGLRWKDENIIEDLKRVVERYAINVVLPFVDPAIAVASMLKKCCSDVFIPVSDENICGIMFDKARAAEWFDRNGIRQPDVYHRKEEYRYPVILKPRTGSASKGIMVCKAENELPQSTEGYLVQKYIDEHKEISVDCYVDSKGNILSVVPRIRLETAGGEAVRSVTVRDREIIALSEQILEAGNFRGPVTIQFLKDRDNNVFVMEINPRLGGGVVNSIGAGSGIAGMIIEEALGKDIMPVTSWKEGTVMTRYYNEVIFYADNY